MGMYLGDSDEVNFLVGDEQVDKLFLGSALVWPMSAITDFRATDNRVGEIRFTWSDTNDPAPNSYDLYDDGYRTQTGITSGTTLDFTEGTSSFFVRALFDGGHSIDSNADSGTSLGNQAPSKITDFAASDNLEYSVSCTWSAASGDPTPTYDIYRDSIKIGESAVAGWIDNRLPGTSLYYVNARNVGGETASNTDSGTAMDTEEPPPEDIPPSPALVFNASDDREDGIMCSWLEPMEGTLPLTHELHDVSGLIYSPVVSPFLWNGGHGEVSPIANVTYGLFIRTVNHMGYSLSNLNEGTKVEEIIVDPPSPVGEQIFDLTGTFIVPEYVTSITICMVGGGGSGASVWGTSSSTINAGGGHSGGEVSTVIAVTSGEVIPVTVGVGGLNVVSAVQGTGVVGKSGTSSAIKGYTANGGAGGQIATAGQAPYAGNGGSQTGCHLTFRDGYGAGVEHLTSASGGEGNTFSNGGDGSYNSNAGVGGYGAGGGGGSGVEVNAWSGYGQPGVVKISWG